MTYILELPWQTPELSPNKRMHWRVRSKITAERRWDAKVCAQAANLEPQPGVLVVAMHYRPRDRRRRDSDNLVLDMKAACDGLVDAGLAVDDDPAHMRKVMPVIHPPERGKPGAIWLALSWEPTPECQTGPKVAQRSNETPATAIPASRKDA